MMVVCSLRRKNQHEQRVRIAQDRRWLGHAAPFREKSYWLYDFMPAIRSGLEVRRRLRVTCLPGSL